MIARGEVGALVVWLKRAWPQALAFSDKSSVEEWADHLVKLRLELAQATVEAVIAESDRPPSIAAFLRTYERVAEAAVERGERASSAYAIEPPSHCPDHCDHGWVWLSVTVRGKVRRCRYHAPNTVAPAERTGDDIPRAEAQAAAAKTLPIVREQLRNAKGPLAASLRGEVLPSQPMGGRTTTNQRSGREARATGANCAGCGAPIIEEAGASWCSARCDLDATKRSPARG